MKRRKAIRNIALISTSVAILPACQTPEPWPVYENLPLEKGQQQFMEWICQAILPKGEILVETPEKRHFFVLSMVNDCYSKRDAEKFLRGLKLMKQHIQDEYKTSYLDLNPQQQALLFTELSKSDRYPKSLQFFLDTCKSLSIRHFTSSEYFLTNHLKYKFIPGPYKGCLKA